MKAHRCFCGYVKEFILECFIGNKSIKIKDVHNFTPLALWVMTHKNFSLPENFITKGLKVKNMIKNEIY